jgi:hypothetical protein
MAFEPIRRREPTFRLPDAPRGAVRTGPAAAASVNGAERPLYLTRAAYVEHVASGQAAPERCTVPDPRAVDRIGAGTPPPPRPASTPLEPDARPAAAGIGGVRRRAGIDAIALEARRGLGDVETTRALVDRAVERYGAGPEGLRIRVGAETLTAGQLQAQLARDPDRVRDVLRAQGISMPELAEVLDDALGSEVTRGTVLDLRAGSELARAYRIGGAAGATVDVHLDRRPTEAAAARAPRAEASASLAGERVERPGFGQMIADAFAELGGWLARLFGGSWNPDTATFDGRVDDARFAARGEADATGSNALMLRALLAQPDGEARLRQRLLAEPPASATEPQWRRAVDDYVGALRDGLTRAERGGAPALSRAESDQVLSYLRAAGNTPDARADVDRALAQPEPIRGHVLALLTELPEAERENLGWLLEPPGERPGDDATSGQRRAFEARTVMASGDPAARVALFETLRRDGFRAAPDSHAMDAAVDAVASARWVDAEVRGRYLALIPQLGVERAELASDLRSALDARPEARGRVLDDVEARVGSTADLERALVGAQPWVDLPAPSAGLASARQRVSILETMSAQNVRFATTDASGARLSIVGRGEGDATTISLDRYFRDEGYRGEVLGRTGLRREAFEGLLTNVTTTLRSAGSESMLRGAESDLAAAEAVLRDPAATREARSDAESSARMARRQLRENAAPSNVEIDLSPGSSLDRTFSLRDAGSSVGWELSRQAVIEGAGRAASLTVRGRAPSGRGAGPTHTIGSAELAALIQNPPRGSTSEEAFRARYPGLDFRETVTAMAHVHTLEETMALDRGDSPTLAVDLTRRSSLAALNTLAAQLRDGTTGNVPPPAGLRFVLPMRSTADVAATDRLWSTSTVGAAAGNNFYQYGWFTYGGPAASRGYFATREAEGHARAAFEAAGRRADPAHVFDALFRLEGHTRAASGHREIGVASGRASDFLRDPRTGHAMRPEDLSVLTFVGAGSATERDAFTRSAARVERMFRDFGGVPEADVERHVAPLPEEMYAAIEAELLHDPRPVGDRDRPRAVVAYFAGHTMSDQTDGVSGMMVAGRATFTPEQVARLTALARERGVNLMWVTDACRAGEYANAPLAELSRAARASGTYTAVLGQLEDLRGATRAYHQSLTALHALPSSAIHGAMPGWRELERLGRDALREGAAGTSRTALDALRARRDRVLADPTTTPNERRIITEYTTAIEAVRTERAALAAAAPMTGISDDGVLTGARAWQPDRPWKTQNLGRLEDRMMEEISRRIPSIRAAEEPATASP